VGGTGIGVLLYPYAMTVERLITNVQMKSILYMGLYYSDFFSEGRADYPLENLLFPSEKAERKSYKHIMDGSLFVTKKPISPYPPPQKT
jgi:hypothetical protein